MRQEAAPRYGAAMRPPFILALAAALLAAGCGLRSTVPTAEVSDAWVRLSPLAGRPAAGYFRIEINGTRETLLEVTSPSADRIELHMSEMEDGRTSMRPIEQASTERGRPIVFEPGGQHMMIHGLEPSLGPGDAIELNFRFLLAAPATALATIVAAGDEAPHRRHRTVDRNGTERNDPLL